MAPFDVSELKGRVAAGHSFLASKYKSAKSSFTDDTESSASEAQRHVESPHADPHSSVHVHNFASSPRLSPDDKAPLFALLDHYFRSSPRNAPSVAMPNSGWRAAPPVNHTTRPKAVSSLPDNQKEVRASVLAHYFSTGSDWSAARDWFAFDNLPPGTPPNPPPLSAGPAAMSAFGFRSEGQSKTLMGVALFEDLSIVYYEVTWDGHDYLGARRQAAWRDAPSPWDGDDLYAASIMYGNLVAGFAEDAEQQRRHVGRGECWDLANEALRAISARADGSRLVKPLPCVGRAHGHLLYHAIAGKRGEWSGGETAVRRGDIVQWSRVRIRPYGRPNFVSTLGDPDHTAIVVKDSEVSGLRDQGGRAQSQPVDTGSIGVLEVIEQSVRQLPSRCSYDMSSMSTGEVWIYRPVPFKQFLGVEDVVAVWPPPITANFVS